MANLVMTDCTVFVGGYDFTADSNKLSLKAEVEDKENTTFGGNGWKSRVGGIRDVTLDTEGYWQSATTDAIDPQTFGNLGTANRAVTVSATGAAASPAYFFQGGSFNYEMFGAIGDVTPFALGHKGTSKYGLIRGQVTKSKGLVSATGALGSAVDLGNAANGQTVYASVHVFSAGTTITLTLERDDNAGFASPTTIHTLSPITSAGSTFIVQSTSFSTNNFYRFNATVITGSFTLAAAIGIGS
ncbi:hypothetical protein Aph01nite_59240 [Acrocarpospora phusangensis]|uniref:Uncharacterized protein n=1 Tax=Acrocarpospora phusangensis TaxID=1070424 RepID=A0A919QE98_9ACTN|nr:hypothetical protein [Acrocarpospora phusangensis]GIH27614.1 hypothetical protein Aph01nite_59240 [Acrocarpospora phusangensis]